MTVTADDVYDNLLYLESLILGPAPVLPRQQKAALVVRRLMETEQRDARVILVLNGNYEGINVSYLVPPVGKEHLALDKRDRALASVGAEGKDAIEDGEDANVEPRRALVVQLVVLQNGLSVEEVNGPLPGAVLELVDHQRTPRVPHVHYAGVPPAPFPYVPQGSFLFLRMVEEIEIMHFCWCPCLDPQYCSISGSAGKHVYRCANTALQVRAPLSCMSHEQP